MHMPLTDDYTCTICYRHQSTTCFFMHYNLRKKMGFPITSGVKMQTNAVKWFI